MRGIFLVVGVVAISGCAAPAAYRLTPPTNRPTGEDRRHDIQDCLTIARMWERKLPLTPEEKAALGDKDTAGFIYQGRPFVDGNTFVPMRRESLLRESTTLTGSREVSDRYVVCLMSKGYRWDVGEGKW